VSIPRKFRIENNENYPYLLDLLINSDVDVHYNDYQLQTYGEGITTCGRWCAYYLKHCDDASIEDFGKFFWDLKKEGYNLDEMVTILTS
jgi:hypothetical protein